MPGRTWWGQAPARSSSWTTRGSPDTCSAPSTPNEFEEWREAEWWPGLRADYPLELATRSAADQEVVELIHAPPVASPSIVERYPAHLHIDLLPRIQRQGIGGRLIGELIDELGHRGIPGLHLDVGSDNEGAIALYRRLGFVELEHGSDSVFMGRGTAPA